MAELLRAEMPGWELDERILEAMVLDHPWRDEEMPSLVAVGERDAVVGFVGVQARRMRHGDEAVRGACLTQLTVASEHRGDATGALLLRRVMNGPQGITWSDSSTDVVLRLWRAFGGHLDQARAADFMLLFRPARWVASMLEAKLRGHGIGRRLLPVRAIPLSGLPAGRREYPRPPEVTGREASAAEIAALDPTVTRHLEVSTAWDEPELERVLGQVRAFDGGLVTRIVRRGDREIGWYAYVRQPGAVSRLLHLSSAKGAVDDVLAEAIADACESGSAVLSGRAEPHLEGPLRQRRATLSFARQPTIRAADPAIAAALATDASLLTRLDGEVFAA